jgi:endoglucanase
MLLHNTSTAVKYSPGTLLTRLLFIFLAVTLLTFSTTDEAATSWIRINLLGYLPTGTKVAVWGSKNNSSLTTFQLIDSVTNKVVFAAPAGKAYGAYGPFTATFRLNFTAFKKPGVYYLRADGARSPYFRINNNVYAGAADYCLRYMRQQRSGFNPFLKDSCHTFDGYTVYGPMPDGTHLDVAGGWHDATDYLQYTTTSANATYHLLAAYRDFPDVFTDSHAANGLDGANGSADVLDEAKWGLDWLMKMYPRKDWLFHQLADDRDHVGFRLPNHDSADYGWGKGTGRPVYFATGSPQGLGEYKNRSTGVASTAGKFTSAFALGSLVYDKINPSLSLLYRQKAESVFQLGLDKPGVCQTACKSAPYFYEESNWVDDMELGSAALYQRTGKNQYYKQSLLYGSQEKVTPWMGADTASHYQWYPFHNFGHYELAKKAGTAEKNILTGYYKQGIERVWQKGKNNAFYRGVPFIWCSNNLTTSFAIQCYLYRQLTGNRQYLELEQASFDWLFGCNPWGTSMVFGLPANGDTPADPHSSFSHLYHYPLDGALVDGPIYGSIYNRMRGLKLSSADEYASFQSDYVVYHDDFGDYSTNEPTMDGTASLIYLLAGKEHEAHPLPKTNAPVIDQNGAIIRGAESKKKLR